MFFVFCYCVYAAAIGKIGVWYAVILWWLSMKREWWSIVVGPLMGRFRWEMLLFKMLLRKLLLLLL